MHSGSAGFGHYYSFIKYFEDGKWYKFNDDHVTRADEEELQATNFTGEKAGGYGWVSTSQRVN